MLASISSIAPLEVDQIEVVQTATAAAERPDLSPVMTVKRNRLPLLDTMRVAAAMGIVWIHTSTSTIGQTLHPLGTFGVPFYTFVAMLFMARSLSRDESKTLGRYVKSRFVRIYTPFLFWSLTYLALGNFKLQLEHLPTHWLAPTALYSGEEEHLWFLPFLMLVTISGAVLYRSLLRYPSMRLPTGAVLILIGGVMCFVKEPTWVSGRTDDYFFFHYAYRALPTACWSIALAVLSVTGGKLPKTSPMVATGGLLLLVTALVQEPALSMPPILRALTGLGCLLVALCPLTSPLLSRIGLLGRHSYGIYLSHIAFLRIVTMATVRLHIGPSLGLDIATFLITFTGAAILSVMLGRSKWTSWTVGE